MSVSEDEKPKTGPEERKVWVTPQVNEIRAGSAEFGDVTFADAQPGFALTPS